MILSIDGNPAPICKHEDINHTRVGLIYFGIKEVKRFKEMNEEWLQKAKKIVAANARQCLQDIKGKVDLINIARQKTMDNIRRLLFQR